MSSHSFQFIRSIYIYIYFNFLTSIQRFHCIHVSSVVSMSVHVFQLFHVNSFMSFIQFKSFVSSHSFQSIHLFKFLALIQLIHVNSFDSSHSCQFIHVKLLISILSFQFICFVHSLQFIPFNSFMSIDSCQSIHSMHFISVQFNSLQFTMNHVSFPKLPPRHVPGTTWYQEMVGSHPIYGYQGTWWLSHGFFWQTIFRQTTRRKGYVWASRTGRFMGWFHSKVRQCL